MAKDNRSSLQNDRQHHRGDGGRYGKVNPCERCRRSAGVSYFSDRRHNQYGVGVVLCEGCTTACAGMDDETFLRQFRTSPSPPLQSTAGDRSPANPTTRSQAEQIGPTRVRRPGKERTMNTIPQQAQTLPSTALALLQLLAENGGAIDYYDARVTISGLTALRHRGLARVDARWPSPTKILLTDDGWEIARKEPDAR